MDSKSTLGYRLQETGNIVRWAITLVPSGRLLESPPHGKHPNSSRGFKTYFGDWPALRQVFHLVFYEETFAIPAMQYCVTGSAPSGDLIFPNQLPEETSWQEALAAEIGVASLLDRLQELEKLQLRTIQTIPDEKWSVDQVETGLGVVSAEFIVSKTIQHRLEHANELMKNALYWERALAWLDRQTGS